MCNEPQQRDVKAELTQTSEGTAPADGSASYRGTGAAGAAGDAQLRALPAGAGANGSARSGGESGERTAAGFAAAAGKTLAAFDTEAAAGQGGAAGADAAGRSFVDRRENVLVFGNPGSGKTHLLSAIGQELVRAGPAGAVHQVRAAGAGIADRQAGPEAEPDCSSRLRAIEGLIIDDLGYVQQSREEMEVLFTLLAERYERGSVLLTSNLPFSKWEGIFKDPMTTAAAIDRLVHHSVIMELQHPEATGWSKLGTTS